jgi:hypothetical protein
MDWNVYLLIQRPAYQVFLFLLLTLALIFIIRPKSADMAWLIAAYMFVLFLIVNAGLLWFDNNPWRYFFYSMGFAVVYLLCVAVLMKVLLGVLKFKSSEESAMAFLVLIYQPFILLFVMLVKWITTKWF